MGLYVGLLYYSGYCSFHTFLNVGGGGSFVTRENFVIL